MNQVPRKITKKDVGKTFFAMLKHRGERSEPIASCSITITKAGTKNIEFTVLGEGSYVVTGFSFDKENPLSVRYQGSCDHHHVIIYRNEGVYQRELGIRKFAAKFGEIDLNSLPANTADKIIELFA